MQVKLDVGIIINVTLADVEAIYKAIPLRDLFKVKNLKSSGSCAEFDVRLYFKAYCAKRSFNVHDIVITKKRVRYIIPKPTEENYHIVMVLFAYITYFATYIMIDSKPHRTIVKKTSELFPALTYSWTKGFIDDVNNKK